MRVINEDHKPLEAACPKHTWVMTTLSDDEACPDSESVSAVLRLLLSQCSSCLALADQLTGISNDLRELADLEPAATLFTQADQQAHQALSDGARLTGRVDIPDEPLVKLSARPIRPWWTYGRFAAAAVILLAVGGYSWFSTALKPLPNIPIVDHVVDGANQRTHEPIPEKAPPDSETAMVDSTEPERNESMDPVICYHRTYQEAAKCEKTNVVHRIRPMGRRLPRRPGLAPLPREGMNAIDKSEGKRSNKGRKRD